MVVLFLVVETLRCVCLVIICTISIYDGVGGCFTCVISRSLFPILDVWLRVVGSVY